MVTSLSAKYWTVLGHASVQDKNFKLATKCFSEALRIHETGRRYYDRGSTYYEQGKFILAVRDFTKSLNHGDCPLAYSLACRGRALIRLGKLRRGLLDLSVAVSIDPDDVSILCQQAIGFEEMDAWQEAICRYELLLSRFPCNLEATRRYAALLATCPNDSLRNGATAMHMLVSCPALLADAKWFTYAVLAATHAELGDYDQAIGSTARALDLAPECERSTLRRRMELYKAKRPYRRTLWKRANVIQGWIVECMTVVCVLACCEIAIVSR